MDFSLLVAQIDSNRLQHSSLDVLVLLLQFLAVLKERLDWNSDFLIDGIEVIFVSKVWMQTLSPILLFQAQLINPVLFGQLHDTREFRMQLVNNFARKQVSGRHCLYRFVWHCFLLLSVPFFDKLILFLFNPKIQFVLIVQILCVLIKEFPIEIAFILLPCLCHFVKE